VRSLNRILLVGGEVGTPEGANDGKSDGISDIAEGTSDITISVAPDGEFVALTKIFGCTGGVDGCPEGVCEGIPEGSAE
jgi:hypothetical protein